MSIQQLSEEEFEVLKVIKEFHDKAGILLDDDIEEQVSNCVRSAVKNLTAEECEEIIEFLLEEEYLNSNLELTPRGKKCIRAGGDKEMSISVGNVNIDNRTITNNDNSTTTNNNVNSNNTTSQNGVNIIGNIANTSSGGGLGGLVTKGLSSLISKNK